MPSILEIFKEHIPGFIEYMEKCNINSNIESLYTKAHSWEIITLLNGLSEIEKAEKKLNDINRDNKIRKKLFHSLIQAIDIVNVMYAEKFTLFLMEQ